jgi:hypothetical protein
MGFPTTDESLDMFIKHFVTYLKMNSLLYNAEKQLENRLGIAAVTAVNVMRASLLAFFACSRTRSISR